MQRVRHGNHSGSAVDDAADRCIDHADRVAAGDKRAEPVGEVDDFTAGNAGEEVFRAAGEAGNFVRKDGTADQNVIVVEDSAVNSHWNVFVEKAAVDFAISEAGISPSAVSAAASEPS